MTPEKRKSHDTDIRDYDFPCNTIKIPDAPSLIAPRFEHPNAPRNQEISDNRVVLKACEIRR